MDGRLHTMELQSDHLFLSVIVDVVEEESKNTFISVRSVLSLV